MVKQQEKYIFKSLCAHTLAIVY